jgi:hypothetical protein
MQKLDFLQVVLNVPSAHYDRLRRLQAEFAAACNLVAPVAQMNRCWNRVALHHLAYREVRDKFPALGSQMACNAVYSVARTYRALLTSPQSPWNIATRPGQPLPLVRFLDDAPVYFDRHTLSLKGGVLSMFTLDGRLRFEISLMEMDAARFVGGLLREIVLLRMGDRFLLQFFFGEKQELPGIESAGEVPNYVAIQSSAEGGPAVVVPA